MNDTGRRRIATLIKGCAVVAAAGVLVAPLAPHAQDGEPGGLDATFDVSAGYRAGNSDRRNDGNGFTSSLGAGLTSTTRSSRLAFRFDGDFQFGNNNSSQAVKFRPKASLDYTHSTRSTEIGFGASYRRELVDGAELFDDFTGEELGVSTGVRQSVSAHASLVTGKDRPFGLDASANYNERTYTQTNDPDLNDRETLSGRLSLRFDVSPVVSVVPGVTYSRQHTYDDFDTEKVSRSANVTVNLQADPAWSLSGTLGFTNVETKRNASFPGDRSITEEGANFNLSAVRALSNGTLSFSGGRSISADGGRDEISVGRDMTLQSGTLAFSLGAVHFDGGSVSPIGTVSYAQDLPRGANFRVSLTQSADTNDDDESILRTRIAANYKKSLTPGSSISIDTSLSRITVVDGNEPDRSRASLGVNYDYALTADWDLSLGATYWRSYRDGSENDSSGVLTARVQRSFSFRP